MRKLRLFAFCVFMTTSAHAQQKTVDSFKRLLYTGNDTLTMVAHKRLSTAFWQLNLDSALVQAKEYLRSAQKLKYPLNEADALVIVAKNLVSMGNTVDGLELLFKALKMVETPNNESLLPPYYRSLMGVPDTVSTFAAYRNYVLANVYGQLSITYWVGGSSKDTVHLRKALALAEQVGAEDLLGLFNTAMGAYIITNPDAALPYLEKGLALSLKAGEHSDVVSANAFHAWAYHYRNDHKRELDFRKMALLYAQSHDLTQDVCWNYQGLAEVFEEAKQYDSSFYYGYKALALARKIRLLNMEMYASNLLFRLYKAQNNKDSALQYLEMKATAYENIFNLDKLRRFQNVDFIQQVEQSAREAEQLGYKNKVRVYALLAGLIVVLLIAGLLWRNIRHKQKAYALVQQQKGETERAYEQLKATQAQLIQREKMASLGELTAGIAHEIQNPLNFVNNFSDVNTELLGELKTELLIGNKEGAIGLAETIKANEEKIKQHGKRTDSIVKGMLQHSRLNTGQKEPTDINKLVEDYMQLSYQGYRARNKGVEVNMQVHYDNNIGKIMVVPQEVGRVLLNLLTNAFYAVNEKKRQLNGIYTPLVTVSTKQEANHITITVQDNGTGMSQQTANKIFHPFFTTKPTGEGTGLGLSLSYDIITKGHGGELRVESEEGAGAAFIVQLPI